MDHVTPTTFQPPITQASDAASCPAMPPQKKSSSAIALLRTLHLKVLSNTSSVVADAAKARIFVPISALGWLSCAAVNRLFKTATWITEVSKSGEQSYTLSKHIQELTHDLIDKNQTIRDSRQSQLQSVASIAQHVPVVGTVISLASTIASKEAEAERAVTWWAKRYTQGVFEFLRYSSPYILQGLHFATSTLEKATGSIQAKLYTGMCNPDTMSNHFRDIADRTNAVQYKALMAPKQYTQFPHLAPGSIKLAPKIHTTALEPEIRVLDTQKIMSQIGPHIVSKGTFYSCFSSIGNAGSSAIASLAATSRSVFESLEASQAANSFGNSVANWLVSGLNKSAFGLELLMILPYGKQIAATAIEHGGIPVYEIEKTFAKLPTALSKHAVMAQETLLNTVRWADDTIQQADKVSKVQEMANTVPALSQATHNSISSFSQAVVEDCADRSTKFICQSQIYEILKSKENIIAHAKKLKMNPESQEFLLAIQEMATSGHILEAINDAGHAAKQAVSSNASSWKSWFEKSIESTIQSLSETRIGVGLQHLGKAIQPTAQGTFSSITANLQKAKDYSLQSVQQLLGKNPPLSGKVKEQMDKWQEAACSLARARAEGDSAKLSEAAILEIGGLWGTLLQQASSNNPFSRFLRETYMNNVHPTLQKALQVLDAAHNISAANYNFLSAQMDANLQTELQMQQFLSEKSKIALKAMQDTNQGAITQTVASVASWGFPILNWLFLSSQTLTVLPFIMQRVVPHVLRSTAETIQSSAKPSWFYLAHNTTGVLNKGAITIQNSSKSLGGWLQHTFNTQISKVTGQGYIDPKRIENFKKLSQEEQEHIFECCEARKKNPNAPYNVLVEQALKILDKKSSLLQDIPSISLREYFQMSSRQQEDILFAVSHSTAFKHFSDTEPERIVNKFNRLKSSEQANFTCKTVKQYQKMTISDKEQIRLCIAKNASLFKDLKDQFTLDIEERMHWNHQMVQMSSKQPIGWEHTQFQALEHTTNHQLRNILQIHCHLQPQERGIMTPSKLKDMLKEKLEHLISIVDTYHPEFAEIFKQQYHLDIYKIFSSIHPIETQKLYSALASIYNMLPPGQRAKLLKLTANEYSAMPEDVKRELTLYLIHTANMANDGDVVATFNSLDSMKQAEFRESKELADLQKEIVTASIEKELSEVGLKLKALQRRIMRLTDGEYLAVKEQVEQTKRLLDVANKEKAAAIKVLDSMKEADAAKHPLQNARKEVDKAKKESALFEKQLLADKEKFGILSNKLSSLHELEHEYIHKLSGLNSLLGTTMDVHDSIDESPKLTAAIGESLHTTLHEVGKSMVESLYSVIKDKTAKADYKQAIAFSREFLDEAILLRKKHLVAVEARILSLKSELTVLKHNKSYEEIAEKRLQLRAHTNFTLKLNQALLAKFIELRQNFETQIPKQKPSNGIYTAPAA